MTPPPMQRVWCFSLTPQKQSEPETSIFFREMGIRYRWWLRGLSMKDFYRVKPKRDEYNVWYFGLTLEMRVPIWREVYDARTLLRPAFAGPVANKDLLVAV